MAGIPELLTVEEAAALLRIGRTKAYAMAKEYRETGGRTGLPVVDLGDVLRVPRRLLEGLLGTELTGAAVPRATVPGFQRPGPSLRDSAGARSRGRRHDHHDQAADQLDLFAVEHRPG